MRKPGSWSGQLESTLSQGKETKFKAREPMTTEALQHSHCLAASSYAHSTIHTALLCCFPHCADSEINDTVPTEKDCLTDLDTLSNAFSLKETLSEIFIKVYFAYPLNLNFKLLYIQFSLYSASQSKNAPILTNSVVCLPSS